MKFKQRTYLAGAVQFVAAMVFGSIFPMSLQADVIVLQSGVVITGNILQQDSSGVLMRTASGTYRYTPALIKEARKEAATARHVSINGQIIPDWAQVVSLLAASGFAPAIQQVPATVIGYGTFKNVPYISFRCGYGDYEINVFGDLDKPAAVQIGAMNYLHQTAAEKTNCVDFICSVLADAADRKIVRALDWNQKDVQQNRSIICETLLPGEMGSYGGWWVSVYDTNELANARASETELSALTQPPPSGPPAAGAVQPSPAPTNVAFASAAQQQATAAQSVTTTTTTSYGYGYGDYPYWTAEELAAAHPAATTTAATTAVSPATTTDPGLYHPVYSGGMYYPRTYTRDGGTYDVRRR
jgi:hypothetical protein